MWLSQFISTTVTFILQEKERERGRRKKERGEEGRKRKGKGEKEMEGSKAGGRVRESDEGDNNY